MSNVFARNEINTKWVRLTMNRKFQRGAVAAEYLIGLIFLVIVLLVPMPNSEGKNILQLLTDAIKQEHTGYINATSLPPIPLADDE